MDKNLKRNLTLELAVAVGNISFLVELLTTQVKDEQKGDYMSTLLRTLKALFTALGIVAELLPSIDSELKKRTEKVLEVNKSNEKKIQSQSDSKD